MRFPHKLWYLLNLRSGALIWGRTGRTILLNYRVLHTYLQCDRSIFKTTNISSFVRQLNLYGFRKVTSHLQDPLCNSSNPYMHEYVHDYFQFGRPELLNKINRKPLTLKKNFKPKTEDLMSMYMTPLQKARQAFRIALTKAVQEVYMDNGSKSFDFNLEFGEIESDDYYDAEDKENVRPEQSWTDLVRHEEKDQGQTTLPVQKQVPLCTVTEDINSCNNGKEPEQNILINLTEEPIPNIMINFKDEPAQQIEPDNFPNQFLSMPDLDPAPNEADDSGVGLLTEFDIRNDMNDGIAKKIKCNSLGNDPNMYLNCMLPSLSNDPIDDVAMIESNSGYSGHYNGEWDQMFNDIMTNKSNSQECSSDLKDLYSQISKTIDLLNS